MNGDSYTLMKQRKYKVINGNLSKKIFISY